MEDTFAGGTAGILEEALALAGKGRLGDAARARLWALAAEGRRVRVKILIFIARYFLALKISDALDLKSARWMNEKHREVFNRAQ